MNILPIRFYVPLMEKGSVIPAPAGREHGKGLGFNIQVMIRILPSLRESGGRCGPSE